MNSSSMSDLSILRGEIYQVGVGSIEQASVIGEYALKEILDDKKAEFASYLRTQSDNSESLNTHPASFSNESLRRMHITSVENSLYELRGAFALSAYHFWETSISLWYLEDNPNETDKDLRGYAGLTRAMVKLHRHDSALPETPDSDLEAVCHLSNILKHASQRSCEWMKENAPPELNSIIIQITQRPLARSIQLTEEQLKWVFCVIRRSGPR